MVGAVTGRTVRMGPPGVSGEQPVERGKEIRLRARAQLEHGDARGGVRNEDVEQPVAEGPAERPHVRREVDELPIGRVHVQIEPFHRHTDVAPPGVERRRDEVVQ